MLVLQEKLAVRESIGNLIEGQVCVFFLLKRRQIRSNKIIIQSARVRGSNKDGRYVFLAVS